MACSVSRVGSVGVLVKTFPVRRAHIIVRMIKRFVVMSQLMSLHVRPVRKYFIADSTYVSCFTARRVHESNMFAKTFPDLEAPATLLAWITIRAMRFLMCIKSGFVQKFLAAYIAF